MSAPPPLAALPAPRAEAPPPPLPHSVDVEEQVIGSILFSGRCIGPVRRVLEPADFYHPAHGPIFAALLALDDAGRPIDIITCAEQMRAADTLGKLRMHGGEVYLAELSAKVGTVANVEDHARTVRRYALRRRGILARRAGYDRALAGLDTAAQDRELDAVAQALAALDAPPRRSVVSVIEAIREDWARPLPPVLATPWPSLDRAMGGGMRAESVAVLVGLTGAGKTGAAGQIARHAAGQGRRVLYLLAELSRRQMAARLLAQATDRPWREVYELGPSEAERLAQDAAPMGDLAIVELARGQTVSGIVEGYAQTRGAPPELLVLDYLQAAARRLDAPDARAAVATLSQEIADLARGTGCAVLAVSSVSRAIARADRGTWSPTDYTTAGAESGAIEYDAAHVLALEGEPCPPGGTAPVKLHVAKSRFSAGAATVGLRFRGAVGLYVEDPTAALSDEAAAALAAVREAMENARGHLSIEAARKAIGGRTARAGQLLTVLLRSGLLRRSPTGRGIELPEEAA